MYKYNAFTKEFEYEYTGKYPDTCLTEIKPPQEIPEGMKCHFNEDKQEWEIRPNNYNKEIITIDNDGYITSKSKNDQNKIAKDKNTIICDSIPENLVKPKWNGEEWIEGQNILELKQEKVNQFKKIAFNLLSETDYMIIREAEGGEACPEEIKQQRAEIRQKCNDLESQLKSARVLKKVLSINWN